MTLEIIKRLQSIYNFYNFTIKLNQSNEEIASLLKEIKLLLLFNDRIQRRICQNEESLLKKKRIMLNLQLLNKINNLNSNTSNVTTCENSPIYENCNYHCDSFEDKRSFNINKFNDISNYTVKGILKSSCTNSDRNIIKHQWSNNIESNKIFMFTDEPIAPELTNEEYEVIQNELKLSKDKEGK